MTTDATLPATRGKGGEFLPGLAPKSPGAPRGPRASDQIRALIEPHREALIARAVELALAGDPQALKLCLDRLAPTPRQEAEKVCIPGLAEAPTFAGRCDAVVRAIAAGNLAPEDGDRVLRALDTYRRAHAADNIEHRLARLETGGRTIVVVDDGGDSLV